MDIDACLESIGQHLTDICVHGSLDRIGKQHVSLHTWSEVWVWAQASRAAQPSSALGATRACGEEGEAAWLRQTECGELRALRSPLRVVFSGLLSMERKQGAGKRRMRADRAEGGELRKDEGRRERAVAHLPN
eukprot:3535867-Rhodomonas_salina.1